MARWSGARQAQVLRKERGKLPVVAPLAVEAVSGSMINAIFAKLNGIDPQAWLADVHALIADNTARQLEDLLTWNRHPRPVPAAA